MDINQFKEFFEQTATEHVVMDTDFTIVAASDSYLKVAMRSRENTIGRNVFDVFPDNPNDVSADGVSIIRGSFDRVLKHRSVVTLPVVKYDITRPESEGGGFVTKYWQPTNTPVFDEHHQVKYIITTVVDITENQALTFQNEEKEARAAELVVANKELAFQNEEKEKRAEELMAANKELEMFVHISSHDLQEPLRKLQIAASRIEDHDCEKITENGKDQFKRMKEAAHSMQTLIEDILTYATATKEPPVIEHSDLNTIIEEVIAGYKEIIDEKQAEIDVSELCEVKVIPFHFRQLMQNLIGNALKFTSPDRKPVIFIKSLNITYSKKNNIKLTPGKEYCHITVADNGIGFEPRYSEKIFEVFQRLHGKEQYNGTGMGLAIVKKIVESQHGVIIATGALGKGATFEIYIPST